MSSPYSSFPDFAYWQRSISAVPAADVDPVSGPAPFLLSPSDRVVTAGSCFAQHIARYLKEAGFNVLITEAAHPIASPATAEV